MDSEEYDEDETGDYFGFFNNVEEKELTPEDLALKEKIENETKAWIARCGVGSALDAQLAKEIEFASPVLLDMVSDIMDCGNSLGMKHLDTLNYACSEVARLVDNGQDVSPGIVEAARQIKKGLKESVWQVLDREREFG